MSEHNFVYQTDADGVAEFKCSICATQMNFVLPGNGTPCAVANGDAWSMPEGYGEHVEGCTGISPVPMIITKRQFLIQMLRSGMVANEEVASLSYNPPAMMDAILANMPTEDALEARLGWAAMTEVERMSPLVLSAAAANNISNQDLDNFFAAAAQI